MKHELSSVQRLMDDLTLAKEEERSELQRKFDQLQSEHDALKKDFEAAANRNGGELEEENKRLINEMAEMKRTFSERSEQV